MPAVASAMLATPASCPFPAHCTACFAADSICCCKPPVTGPLLLPAAPGLDRALSDGPALPAQKIPGKPMLESVFNAV